MSIARPDLRKKALAMHEADPARSNGAIARELGVQTSTVWHWVNLERSSAVRRRSNAKRASVKRAWENEHDRSPCPTCGEPMGAGGHRRGDKTCMRCRIVAAEMRELEMIRLRCEEGLSNDEIAQRVGATKSSVATILCRARRAGAQVPRDPYMTSRRERVAA